MNIIDLSLKMTRGEQMRFLHTMIRVYDLDKAMEFWTKKMDFVEIGRDDYEDARFTLVFLKNTETEFVLELTHNWDQKEEYSIGRNFGHLAFEVENIYQTCDKLMQEGIEILRPPRDGYMAFVRAPDQISIEFLQKGERLKPQEPWASMSNTGSW